MVAKGAWLNRPQIIRQARVTNRHDVQQEKVRQLGEALPHAISKSNHWIAERILKAIKEVAEQ